MRLWSPLLSLLFAVVAASCAAESYYPASEMGVDGYASGAKGEVVSLDDVTNGLVNESARAETAFDSNQWSRLVRDPAGNPLAGQFFADTDDDGLPDSVAAGSANPRPGRMLIYRGNLAIEVPRAEDAAKAFLAQVEAWGGYLQSQTGARLSVGLPAERFDEAFAAAKGSGRVLHEQRSANDVTEEFVDLGIRLDNARKSRERLIELLQKADKVEDMLKIENELRRLTEEIERMEGRVKFLRDQVAMATLDIEFRSVAEAPPPPPHRRQPSRFSWINLVGASNLMERF